MSGGEETMRVTEPAMNVSKRAMTAAESASERAKRATNAAAESWRFDVRPLMSDPYVGRDPLCRPPNKSPLSAVLK